MLSFYKQRNQLFRVWSDAEIPRSCQICEWIDGHSQVSTDLNRRKICASTEAWQWEFWDRLSGFRQDSQTRRGIVSKNAFYKS